MPTKAELESEVEDLRAKMEAAREIIDSALNAPDEVEDDEADDDEDED